MREAVIQYAGYMMANLVIRSQTDVVVKDREYLNDADNVEVVEVQSPISEEEETTDSLEIFGYTFSSIVEKLMALMESSSEILGASPIASSQAFLMSCAQVVVVCISACKEYVRERDVRLLLQHFLTLVECSCVVLASAVDSQSVAFSVACVYIMHRGICAHMHQRALEVVYKAVYQVLSSRHFSHRTVATAHHVAPSLVPHLQMLSMVMPLLGEAAMAANEKILAVLLPSLFVEAYEEKAAALHSICTITSVCPSLLSPSLNRLLLLLNECLNHIKAEVLNGRDVEVSVRGWSEG